MTGVIDAHQHYWDPARGDYGWMPKDDPVLSRVYGPGDLAPQLAAAGVARTVLVQAAPSLAETDYLLAIADRCDSIAAVVGWIDFEDGSQRRALERLARHPKFRGVRPMVQDIPDVGWILRDDVQWACRAICDLDLTFDALGFPRHIGPFLSLFERYPAMRVVIDHCLKPGIAGGADPEAFGLWAVGMSEIARRTTAYCKLSGLVTEAGPDWSADQLRPYVHHVIEAFGPHRVMWGSDWPVCRLRAEYAQWHETARALTDPLGPEDKAQIFGGSAARFYRL